MSGYFARVTERVFGDETSVRPARNRYQIALAGDEAPALSSERFERRAVTDRAPSPEAARPQPERHAPSEGDAPAGARLAPSVPLATIPRESMRLVESEPPVRSASKRAPVAEPRDAASRAEVPERVDEPRARAQPQRSVEPQRSAEPRRSLEPRLLPVRRPAPPTTIGEALARPPASRHEPAPVHVHIGRIDLRAAEAPPPQKPVTERAMRRPSLEEHLRARERGLR